MFMSRVRHGLESLWQQAARSRMLVRHATANIGTITANGQEQTFPDSDVIEIPGVARLERNIVKKIKNGLSVTALRITLLDGSGAVANLGEGKFYVKRADR